MERSSIPAAIVASLEDTATPTTTPRASMGQSPLMPKQADSLKRKELAHAAAKTKRTREWGELEPARKKTSQGPRLVDSAELREVFPSLPKSLHFEPPKERSLLALLSFPRIEKDLDYQSSGGTWTTWPRRSRGPPHH